MCATARLLMVSLACVMAGACSEVLVAHPAPETTAVGRSEGQRYPDVTLIDEAGRTSRLSEYRGRVVFLNFWASWCPPCRQEWPSIQALYDRLHDQDIVFLLVVTRENLFKGRAWAQANGYTAPLYSADETPFAVPETFVIDRNGVIVKATLAQDWGHDWPQRLLDLSRSSAPDSANLNAR